MENWKTYEARFRYMMLSRMKQDCDYYLGYGGRSANHLWAGNEFNQIMNMKALWETFKPENNPEWLTKDELKDYASQMGVDLNDW